MKTNRLGCLSPSALVTALITLGMIFGGYVMRGGAMFSPGELNAQVSLTTMGGVTSHADLAQDCAACHAAYWSEDDMRARCTACHTDLMDSKRDFHVIMHAEGELTPCQSCHTEHHGANASLTTQPLIDFPHNDLGFALTRHQKTSTGETFTCRTCHPNQFTIPEQSLCIDCHTKYQAEFMQNHIQAFPGNCLVCHDGLDRFTEFDHSKVGFILTGQHSQVACQSCHTQVLTLADLKIEAQECRACHAAENPHADQFSTDCSACHTSENWLPSTYDHASSDYPLVGKHQTVQCNDCHNQSGQSGERIFVGTTTDCAACHAADEPHEGRFGQDCYTCHTPEGWLPANFNHNLARFTLLGKHREVECEACHTTMRANGFPQYQGTPSDCISCHQKDDAHGGSLGANCTDCHTSDGWVPSTFDHAQSTMPLTGAHMNAACQSCHNQIDAAGHRVYKGTPTACRSCHSSDDAHNGQFGTDCQTCHSTSAWKPATFDHSRAAFQLTGAHASTACKSCHTQGWKGTPSACAACHGEPALHAGVFGTKCQDCHNTSAWRPASFNGSHSFPMNHGDANSCSDCHPSSYGSWTCYTCHNQGEIEKKHKEEGIGDFSNCVRCHADGREDDD